MANKKDRTPKNRGINMGELISAIITSGAGSTKLTATILSKLPAGAVVTRTAKKKKEVSESDHPEVQDKAE